MSNKTKSFPAMLEDRKLSWKAKGILAYLLSQPKENKITLLDITKESTDGSSAVKSAMAELRRHGYVKLTVTREAGVIRAWDWHVSDRPIFKNDGAPSR